MYNKMTSILTKQNQNIIQKLGNKDYDGITQRQITTMLKKVLDYDDQRAKKVSKDVYDFEVYKFPKKTSKQVEQYISKKLDKTDKAVFRESISDYTSNPEISKNKAQQAKTQTQEREPIKNGKGKPTKSNGTSSELDSLLDKLLSDDQSVTESTYKKPKLKAMASQGVWDNGVYMGDEGEALLPNKGKTVTVVDPPIPNTEFEKWEPYSGKSYKLSDLDLQRQEPATFDDFMERNNRKDKKPDEVDYKAYKEYLDNAKEGIDGLKDEWGRIQDSIKRNRDAVRNGDKELGQRLTDENDPLHILRGLGYEYKSDFDDESVGMLVGSAFRGAGDVAKTIPGVGEVISSGLEIIGDIAETGVDWLEKIRAKRDYDWGKFDLEDYRGQRIDGEYTNRTDKYYRPDWSYTETYLPTDVDPFGRVDPYNKGKQDKYLLALEFYSKDLMKSSDYDFIDSVRPEQKKFLEALKKTVTQIRMGELNITHKQYRDLLMGTINEFTSSQRQSKTLQDIENKVAERVNYLYSEGDGAEPWETVEGSKAPFADKIINDIKKATSTKSPENDPDPSKTETSTEKEEEKKDDDKKKEKEKEEDDDPDDPDKPDKPEEDPDPDPEEEGVKEVPLDTSSSKQDGKDDWPKLRPRMKWGNTDEMFMREKKEVQQANLISEAMGMEEAGWGNKADNPLYKRNLIQDQMRYNKCFAMPSPQAPDPLQLPSKFIQMTQPVMISQYAPIGRSFEVGRDPYQFGQYQSFNPAYQQTVYPSVEQRVQTGEYPYIADVRTGGLEQEVGKWDYLTNLRFTS